MRNLIGLVSFLFFTCSNIFAQGNFIHVDQFGYPAAAAKVAVLSDPQVGYNNDLSYTPPAQLEVRNADNDQLVMSVAPQVWNGGATHDQSGDRGWWLDFSTLTNPGQYYIFDAVNNESSAVFQIDDIIYNEVMIAAGRAFFYNRCNAPKNAPYADANWTDGIPEPPEDCT